jgi:RNA polymerase sigma-70 factor (ECF subfamily)
MPAPVLDEIVNQHFDRIRQAALVLRGNPWDADDLAQETFLLFSRDYERFEGRSTTYTWLYGILLNLDRHYRRRQGIWRRKFKDLCDRMVGREPTVPPAEASLETAEWKDTLWAQVAGLPEPQREILVLRFSAGLRYEEISRVVGCPLGTVKSRIHHGLIALRRRLEENETAAKEIPCHPYEDLVHAF